MRMRMPVMDVRVMRMLVRQHLMSVRMRMGLRGTPGESMLVLVVFVMPMPMAVLKRLMRVLVLMPLANMQPDADGHQRRGQPE